MAKAWCKGNFSCSEKGKGLDLGAEPLCIKLCWVPNRTLSKFAIALFIEGTKKIGLSRDQYLHSRRMQLVS